ncbi:MAG: HAD family hydrolase [Gorillibacterium sp.]|nr:HAD family hydrolase [Gorillibacterium sp.]
MEVTTIVFDLDDTLYPERDYVLSGFKAVGERVFRQFGHAGFYESATRLFHSGESALIFNRVLDQLGLAYNNQLITELVACYRLHEPEISLSADAQWLLGRISAEVKLGLLSDGYKEAQEQKVMKLNLDHYFHAVVLSDTLGREHWKPSPVPYQEMVRLLHVQHEACLYVGDNASKDFITAKTLGWRTVRLKRPDGVYADTLVPEEFEAHYQIDNLRQLTTIPEFKQLFRLQSIELDPIADAAESKAGVNS